MTELYNRLNNINVNEFTEEKNGLTYLSWASAFRILQQYATDIEYAIIESPEGLVYWDTPMGIYVKTEFTVDGTTKSMMLPVMDFKNNAMFSTPGKVINFGKETDRPVAKMTDINNAIMRCYVKNIAMFGLGAYIYEGRDEPVKIDAFKAKAVKVQSQAEVEENKKREMWAKFNEDLKHEEIDLNKFLEFYKIKMTQKVKLMKFVEEFTTDDDVRNQLVSDYKSSL